MAQNKKTLAAIKAALKLFPKIVKEKEKAYREKEKVMKQFKPFSLKLQKLTAKNEKEFTVVREHPRNVPISEKNPDGVTIVDRHPRRLPGTSLSADEIRTTAKEYDLSKVPVPAKNKLKYRNADKYDDLIAFWVDYFNRKFESSDPLDPDVLKALIGSESSFDSDPKQNRNIALGLTQITRETLKLLQDPEGEAKDFIFTNIRLKDLKDPEIAIPLATRWLFRKKETATKKLKREPTAEELILEYKGLLRSQSAYKERALKKFRKDYGLLKN